MIDKPPDDPADHAEDFAKRYAESMDYHVSQRMMELGIPVDQIGASAPEHGIRHAAFHPRDRTGGTITPDGRLTVDCGVFHPGLLDHLGPEVAALWPRSRLRDRLDAIIAHEFEEHVSGSHEGALGRAPETSLPIREKARHLLRVIAEATKRQRGP